MRIANLRQFVNTPPPVILRVLPGKWNDSPNKLAPDWLQTCQCKVEMSPNLQSRDVPFWKGS